MLPFYMASRLFSNRSACYVKLKKFEKALADARKCAALKPEWSKASGMVFIWAMGRFVVVEAYFRIGQAQRGLRHWEVRPFRRPCKPFIAG